MSEAIDKKQQDQSDQPPRVAVRRLLALAVRLKDHARMADDSTTMDEEEEEGGQSF